MTTDSVLSVSGVKKRFCRNLRRSLMYGVADIASDFRMKTAVEPNLRKGEFWALQGVSFDVSAGESVALIGRNGAGKSTLLKLINGLFMPDAGQISVRGRVAALIELGTGFNPILSGRENVYVNGAVLGISKQEIDQNLEEIVEFSELAEFIDMPLRSYSSGMKVRLGFSVATQLKPDILLIDEVLAVGDADFRAKCYRRLSEIRQSGTAFVLVSHNPLMLQSACSRGIVLDKGTVVEDGPINEALQRYQDTGEDIQMPETVEENRDADFSITSVRFGASGVLTSGDPGEIVCAGVARVDKEQVSLSVLVKNCSDMDGQIVLIRSADYCGRFPVRRGSFKIRFLMDPVVLSPGTYSAKLNLNTRSNLNSSHILDGVSFSVLPREGVSVATPFQPCSVTVESSTEIQG